MMKTSFALLFAALGYRVAWAADAVAPAPSLPAPVSDLGGSALQMLLGLIVVLGVLLLSLWLLTRLSQPRGAAAGLMRVIAGVAIGPRERVVILELGGSWLVLGVAPGQVTTLAEMPRQELPSHAPQSGVGVGAGPDWLKQLFARREKKL